MKRICFLFGVSILILSCAGTETRLPSSTPPVRSLKVDSDDTFKSLPGDENVKNSEIAYNLALEYAQSRNMNAAHHYIDLAMRLEPHAKYSYTKGVFYLGEKRYDKAILWLDKSMSQGPDELQAKLDILNAQGIALMHLKRYDEAKTKFREIINTEGLISKFNAYYNLGLIYLEEGSTDDAESVLRKALEENPNDYRVYVKLGNIAKKKGDYLSAYGDFSKASELVEQVYSSLQVDGPEVYFNLAESLLKLNRVEECRNALLKVIKISPEGPFGLKAKEVLSKLPQE